MKWFRVDDSIDGIANGMKLLDCLDVIVGKNKTLFWMVFGLCLDKSTIKLSGIFCLGRSGIPVFGHVFLNAPSSR